MAFLDSDGQADVNQGQNGDSPGGVPMRKGKMAGTVFYPGGDVANLKGVVSNHRHPSLDLLTSIMKPQGHTHTFECTETHRHTHTGAPETCPSRML